VQAAPSAFTEPAAPPPPDEIVIDKDLEFSLVNEAPPQGSGARVPFPPSRPFPSPPPAMPPAPPPLGAGELPFPWLPPPPQAPFASSQLASVRGADLGLDGGTLPARPSTMSDPALDAGDFMPSPDALLRGSSLGMDSAPPPAPPPMPDLDASFADLAVAASGRATSLPTRLSALAARLRAEGRGEDADLVAEAGAKIDLVLS
jgi:hypothetical protein